MVPFKYYETQYTLIRKSKELRNNTEIRTRNSASSWLNTSYLLQYHYKYQIHLRRLGVSFHIHHNPVRANNL